MVTFISVTLNSSSCQLSANPIFLKKQGILKAGAAVDLLKVTSFSWLLLQNLLCIPIKGVQGRGVQKSDNDRCDLVIKALPLFPWLQFVLEQTLSWQDYSFPDLLCPFIKVGVPGIPLQWCNLSGELHSVLLLDQQFSMNALSGQCYQNLVNSNCVIFEIALKYLFLWKFILPVPRTSLRTSARPGICPISSCSKDRHGEFM